jgi:tRNA (guanine37-N1)-methyltransferase
MRIEIATLFPEMCENVLNESIIGRARCANLITINCRNIRDYTEDKHRRVDDSPYGGGFGMVMQAQPIYNCYKALAQNEKPYVVYMSPKGTRLSQQKIKELSAKMYIMVICGHYEGVDQRLIDKIVDEEISVGDYVVTGGELPALILVDAITRLQKGVLKNDECFKNESHWTPGILEEPQYTRPEIWEGMAVPEVLLSGHHKNIETWKNQNKITEESGEQ